MTASIVRVDSLLDGFSTAIRSVYLSQKKFQHHNRKLDIRVDNRTIVVLKQDAGQ